MEWLHSEVVHWLTVKDAIRIIYWARVRLLPVLLHNTGEIIVALMCENIIDWVTNQEKWLCSYICMCAVGNLLTQYTLRKPSGTAWCWWLECTFARQPDEGPCRISAPTQISPIPHHCSSGGAGEDSGRLQFRQPETTTLKQEWCVF